MANTSSVSHLTYILVVVNGRRASPEFAVVPPSGGSRATDRPALGRTARLASSWGPRTPLAGRPPATCASRKGSQSDEVLRVVELTALVTRSRKRRSMVLFRPLCSSEVASSTLRGLALDIRHLDSQDLPKAVLAERTNDQGALTDDPGAESSPSRSGCPQRKAGVAFDLELQVGRHGHARDRALFEEVMRSSSAASLTFTSPTP